MKTTLPLLLFVVLTSAAVLSLVANDRQEKSKRVQESEPVFHYTFDSRTGDDVSNERGEFHLGQILEATFAQSLAGDSALMVRKDNLRSGYIEIADHDDLNSPTFTIAAWIKLRRDSSNGSIVCKHDWNEGPGRGFVLRCYSSEFINFTLGTGRWNNADGMTPVPANEWIHAAGTFDGTHMRVYFNGRLDGTTEVDEEYRPSPYALRIGHGAYVLERQRKFDGQIDDVMFWNRALSETELTSLYEEQLATRPDPLTADQIAPLVEELGSDSFEQRIAAEQRLIEFDTEILPLLKPVMEHDDPEIAFRAKQIEKAINRDLPE